MPPTLKQGRRLSMGRRPFFFGDGPDELNAATERVQLGAEFGSRSAGSTRRDGVDGYGAMQT